MHGINEGQTALATGLVSGIEVLAIKGSGAIWWSATGSFRDSDVVSARPVLVIDPYSRASIDQVAEEYDKRVPRRCRVDRDDLAAALKAVIHPPRIPEPTTWGIVEASTSSMETGRVWTHHADGEWKSGGSTIGWRGLINPTLIREGI